VSIGIGPREFRGACAMMEETWIKRQPSKNQAGWIFDARAPLR
jgi:hypothetical protein